MVAAYAGPICAESPDQIETTRARFKTTFETVELPLKEKMGLMGGNFLFDANDWFSIGGGAYGALTGQRGGFITLGLATELRQELGDIAEVNAGFFVGGGGGRGGYTLQGGGLMLRYHLGAQLNSRFGNLGGGVSYVDFPNGNIHSLQPYLSYEFPFTTLILSGWQDSPRQISNGWRNVRAAEQEFAVVYRAYKIPSGVRTDTGGRQHPSMRLMGVEWLRYLEDNFFLKVESEGAMGGRSNGYMQIFLGGGYRLLITRSTWAKLSAALGVAGGGSVDTGGGLLLDGTVALQQKLGDHLYAEVAGGYVKSPGASFRAWSVAGKLGYHFYTPDVRKRHYYQSDFADYEKQNLRIRTTQQTYFKAASNWRNHHANQRVKLLGFQADYFATDHLYLTGQGIAAYAGNAGGYMKGLVGGGVHLPLFGSPLFVDMEALVGAAGGGGLDVAGGFVWQANAGLGLDFADSYSAIATYGYMSAPKGNFRAKVLSLSLAYRFSIFTM